MAIPVSLEDAKRQLRHYDEDLSVERQTEIEGFIADAAAWVERYTGHILVARDVTEQFRVPARTVQLKAWPISPDAAVSASYVPTGGVETEIAGIRLDISRRPARVTGLAGWPLRSVDELLTITVRAGYEDDADPPKDFRRAMLVLIAAYDADREGGDLFAKAERAAARIVSSYRWRGL
jgi:hypothetical protein